MDVMAKATMRDMSRYCQRDMSLSRSAYLAGNIPAMNEAIFLRIKKRLDALGLTEAAACREAGIGRDAIRDIRRRPHILPRIDTLAALAVPLETTPEWLAFGRSPEQSEREPAIEVPLVSWVAASKFADVPQVSETDAGKKLHLTDLAPGRYIALIVDGDSMNQVAPVGSTIIVRLDAKELIDKKYYVFYGDEGATFKRFRANPIRLEPASFNPEHDAIFPKNDVKPIGQVMLVLNYL